MHTYCQDYASFASIILALQTFDPAMAQNYLFPWNHEALHTLNFLVITVVMSKTLILWNVTIYSQEPFSEI